jgi:hypothetical protein
MLKVNNILYLEEMNMENNESIVKKPKRRMPSLKTMERWVYDGVAKATDGCKVEPDGVCPHGKNSWLIELGMI